ncbi:RNA polymerase sigma-70 factor (ECF subfamily) [Paenibacillus phyllosphaerae]|uniref:RNA polymerase sigma-70 factor (ECF subfamily) n=1 Tax=Paenibacillus phyllosphaerae TaxID=274593 RepID=A0A7W5B5V1_9BACL|nr:RNA polymerase sigma factor [Paenibacillus phyllosphaerae]MBB3114511.1 RNA polymerase sigma-70 factor (ECF subfamily) [Paenibacillus phyllosphaerae]
MQPWIEFEDAVKPHFQPLRTYCSYLTASRWEAEDLFQDVLLRAFQHYQKVGEFSHPRSLLYKIARNLTIDAHRRRRGITVSIDEALQRPYHDQNYASVRGLLEWMADYLSEREVEMLLLAEVLGYSYQDIAQQLNCTVPAVKMVLHRSKSTLRKRALSQYDPGMKPDRAAKKRPKSPQISVERWTNAMMSLG